MLRAALILLTLGGLPRGCACTDAGDLLPATTVTQTSTSTSTAPASTRATSPSPSSGASSGASGGDLALPDGVGPVSGGKCTVPDLVDVDVHEIGEPSLEERLFGTRGAEISVAPQQPCP